MAVVDASTQRYAYRIHVQATNAQLLMREHYLNLGYAHTQRVLNGDAMRALHRWLRDEASWGLTVCDGKRIAGVAPNAYRECTTEDLKRFSQIAYHSAKTGFAFVREELWELSSYAEGNGNISPPIAPLLEFFKGSTFMQFLCEITGLRSPVIVHFGIERYRRGHFCAFPNTPDPKGKVGFFLDLTPTWFLEWGGLLEFYDFFGCVERAYVPRFNSVTVHSLSKTRSVSIVAPFACADRYVVAGEVGDA